MFMYAGSVIMFIRTEKGYKFNIFELSTRERKRCQGYNPNPHVRIISPNDNPVSLSNKWIVPYVKRVVKKKVETNGTLHQEYFYRGTDSDELSVD